jgi:putative ABC transport system permease protein
VLPETTALVPAVARDTTIRAGNRASRVRLIGTVPEYLVVRSFALAGGRFISATMDETERVIVLGAAVSRELAPSGIRTGDTVLLAGHPYTVIGLLQPQGVNFAGEDEDHQVFIPLSTYQRRIANRPWLSHFYVQLPPNADTAGAITSIQTVLRQRHGRWNYQVDDVLIRNLADIAGQQSGLLTTVAWVISVTSGLLLLMGAIGVATLMVLVVRQRRSEIGLRRALGATPLDIAFQFFIEGLMLAGAGIVAGVVIGLSGSLMIPQMFSMPYSANYDFFPLAVLISLVASTAACVIPAAVAARLEPAAALRP